MVVVCPGLRLLFIHIPKTGGSAISLALDRWAERAPGRSPRCCCVEWNTRESRGWQLAYHPRGKMHATWEESKHWAEPLVDDGYRVFGVLRNPWDRAASLYDTRMSEHRPVDHLDIAEFLDQHQGRLFPFSSRAFCGPHATLLRFESLQDDLLMHGVDVRLDEVNKRTRVPSVRSVFGSKGIAAVAERCVGDITLGGYSPP